MWIYQQATGNLIYDGETVGTGYSGHEQGKNNPQMQDDPGIGPIPVGGYSITPPRDTQTHGPFVLGLIPFPNNQMFGRSGFLMHGDSIAHPGEASLGCIVIARSVREQVWNSGDHFLRVESGIDQVPDLGGEISV